MAQELGGTASAPQTTTGQECGHTMLVLRPDPELADCKTLARETRNKHKQLTCPPAPAYRRERVVAALRPTQQGPRLLVPRALRRGPIVHDVGQLAVGPALERFRDSRVAQPVGVLVGRRAVVYGHERRQRAALVEQYLQRGVVAAVAPVWKSTSVSGAFLGDDAADLARSSGEEPASPRH